MRRTKKGFLFYPPNIFQQNVYKIPMLFEFYEINVFYKRFAVELLPIALSYHY